MELMSCVGSMIANLGDLPVPIVTRSQMIALIQMVIGQAEAAARADEGVKATALREALREYATNEMIMATGTLLTCMICSQNTWRETRGPIEHLDSCPLYELPEAPPVELSEEQERERMMDAKVIPDDRFPGISKGEGT